MSKIVKIYQLFQLILTFSIFNWILRSFNQLKVVFFLESDFELSMIRFGNPNCLSLKNTPRITTEYKLGSEEP